MKNLPQLLYIISSHLIEQKILFIEKILTYLLNQNICLNVLIMKVAIPLI